MGLVIYLTLAGGCMKRPKNYAEWVKKEGGVEHPTHLETLQQPEQLARIRWFKRHLPPKASILDLGCNWGYVSNLIGATTGVDINPENIEKAMREFPHIHFIQGDITKKWQIDDKQYDVVVMAEVLEHIDDAKLGSVLLEADRVARWKILITMPWKKDDNYAYCFKHKWFPSSEKVMLIAQSFCGVPKITIECDGVFIYLEIIK